MSNKYDLGLFEQLNEEYREKPISPLASQSSNELVAEQEMADYKRTRVGNKLRLIQKYVDLAGRVVLEIGCGHGWTTNAVAEMAGARQVIGVDIKRYPTWEEHQDPRVTFVEGDLSQAELVEPESVDLVISSVVFEHVSRPVQMLEAIHRTLRPEGIAWLHLNLYRARNASHRYREIFFPWPHLLFDEEICATFYLKHYGAARHFSWVNRMTVAHYLQACKELGYFISVARLRKSPIDVPFYVRFIDRLGKYPALDLETDFLILELHKAPIEEARLPSYVESQRALDKAVEEYHRTQPEVGAG